MWRFKQKKTRKKSALATGSHTGTQKCVCCTDFIQCVQVRLEYVLRCSRLEHLAPVQFFITMSRGPFFGRCRKISNVVFEQNRVVTESATTIFPENTSTRQTSCIYQWVNLSSVCYNRFQMLRISSNFETCHALEATTVMKIHLGCCSIKWIHIGFLLLAIWRSYLTTSLQNVCVCVCMLLNDLLRVGVLWKNLWNLRAIPAIHPLVCSYSSENTISTSGLLYLCVFPYTCHIYFNVKTQRKWLQAPSKQLFKVQDPISLVCGLHIPLFPKARAS